MAVALKTIQVIEAERLMASAARMGKYILKRLGELDEKYPQIVGVDGLGLMLRVELDTKAHRDWVVRRAFEAGLLLLGCGTKTIRIAPPLIIGQDDADVGLDILDRVIAQLTGYGK
jgi:4-aminobutyrate aminotransferase-like enzyme